MVSMSAILFPLLGFQWMKGCIGQRGSGTLGAFLVDGAGKHYALTNAHVVNKQACLDGNLPIHPLAYRGQEQRNPQADDVLHLAKQAPAKGAQNPDVWESADPETKDFAYVKLKAGLKISCRYARHLLLHSLYIMALISLATAFAQCKQRQHVQSREQASARSRWRATTQKSTG